jgi:hypothetical protein
MVTSICGDSPCVNVSVTIGSGKKQPTKTTLEPISEAWKVVYAVSCLFNQEPEIFTPIDAKTPRPVGSTDTPTIGQEDPGGEAARKIAELLANLDFHKNGIKAVMIFIMHQCIATLGVGMAVGPLCLLTIMCIDY